MIDKTQRIRSYKSGTGITVYEVEQYNKNANAWYIVGDCSTNKKYIETIIELHNLKLKNI